MCRFPKAQDTGYWRLKEAVDYYMERIKIASEKAWEIPLIEVPFPRHPGFIGRDAELEHLQASFFGSEMIDEFVECAIVGLGGVG